MWAKHASCIVTVMKDTMILTYQPLVSISSKSSSIWTVYQSNCKYGKSTSIQWTLALTLSSVFAHILKTIFKIQNAWCSCDNRDTAGQERFRTLTTAYYRGAMGILLMYDVTSLESYNNLSYWLRNIQEVIKRHLKICENLKKKMIRWFVECCTRRSKSIGRK